MVYSEFIRNLRVSDEGTTEERNKANERLLAFRAKSPEEYRKYTERLRSERKKRKVIW